LLNHSDSLATNNREYNNHLHQHSLDRHLSAELHQSSQAAPKREAESNNKEYSAEQRSGSTEYWKGNTPDTAYSFGALGGLAILSGSAGGAIIGTFSALIEEQGFVPEINNQVSFEAQAGPLFVSGDVAFFYSLHLRWDFHRDEKWAYYAIGGIAGSIEDQIGGSRWLIYPRVGLGALMKIKDTLSLRGEVSHEIMAVGVQFGF